MKVRAHILMAGAVLCAAGTAIADTVIAARTIPVRTIIAAEDLSISEASLPGSLTDQSAALGLEARVTIYEGRPIRQADLGPPALVDRNEIVSLQYDRGSLSILTEGRVLDRAGQGDRVRVMNLTSRITVSGRVAGPGLVIIP